MGENKTCRGKTEEGEQTRTTVWRSGVKNKGDGGGRKRTYRWSAAGVSGVGVLYLRRRLRMCGALDK